MAYGGEYVTIARNGHSAGVLIPMQDYERYRRWEQEHREAR